MGAGHIYPMALKVFADKQCPSVAGVVATFVASFSVVKTSVIKWIDVVIHNTSACPVYHHKDDCCGEDTPNDDQQKLHALNVARAQKITTPAKVSASLSADLAMIGRNEPGKSAHIPLFAACGFMVASETEESSWLTIHNRRQAVAAASASSLRQSLLCWCYSTRYSLADQLKQQQTQRRSVQLKQHQLVKKQHRWWTTRHLLCLRSPQQNKATHPRRRMGGRSNASAFCVFAPLLAVLLPRCKNTKIIPCIEVCPC